MRALALVLALLFSAALAAGLAGCGGREDYFVGFSLSETVYVGGQPLSARERRALEGEIASFLHAVEDEVSLNREDSCLSRLNAAAAGEAVAAGNHTRALFSLSAALHAETGGAFSPALWPLSELWGFSPRFAGRYADPRPAPSAADVQEALALSDLSLFTAEGETLSKAESGAGLDFGGIAKGYMCDVAAAYIREKYAGEEVGCVLEVMSGSVILGSKPASALGYTASVDNPRAAVTAGKGAGQALFAAGLSDVAVSTSADNYRFYVYGGKIYPHILDPFRGAPADNGVISVTVFVPLAQPYAAASADAYSTAGFCMPLREALAFYEGLYREKGVSALVITADFCCYTVGDAQIYGRTAFDGLVGQEGYFSEEVFAFAETACAPAEVEPCARELEYIAACAQA